MEGQKEDIDRNQEKTIKLLDDHLSRVEAAESYKGKFDRVEGRYDWLEERLKEQAEQNPNELAEEALD